MKALLALGVALVLALALSSLCATAMADEVAQQVPVEHYDYSHNLDIAKIVSISEIPNVCQVVPARMIYEDSQGKRHILEYRVMGNGCSNG